MKNIRNGRTAFVKLIFVLAFSLLPDLSAMDVRVLQSGVHTFTVPEEYLLEKDSIPEFWLSTVEDVAVFLYENVGKGELEIIGTSAGGRPLYAVTYGRARQGKGTTTFSGALSFRDLKAYRGRDHDNTVYMSVAAVHGGEFEGIVGMVNLISVIETGSDLRGKRWPKISEAVSKLDRLVLIPIMNPDGRARLPLKMEPDRGTDHIVHEYLNTGGHPDGTIIGWPNIKEFIPLDFGRPVFPGGYPNGAGVNIQHDDFFGKRQPETQALFDLAESERPDLILNMHTGAVYMNFHAPMCEPALSPVYDALSAAVFHGLAGAGLQEGDEEPIASAFGRAFQSRYNINTALNLHCGALSITVESPSHGFSGKNSRGEAAVHTPEMLLEAQLICHREAMMFLVRSGGRSRWSSLDE